MREFVSARANGAMPVDADEIVVSFYGPRGGTRTIQAISIESAEEMRRQLGIALSKFKREKV